MLSLFLCNEIKYGIHVTLVTVILLQGQGCHLQHKNTEVNLLWTSQIGTQSFEIVEGFGLSSIDFISNVKK